MTVSDFKLKRPEPTEAAVLNAVLRALRIHPAVAWHGRFNSGAQVIGEGNQRRYVRFSTVKGLSDVAGQLKDGRFFAIEVKRPSGRVTDEQMSFINQVNKNNGIAFVARSVSDVFERLDGVPIRHPQRPAT